MLNPHAGDHDWACGARRDDNSLSPSDSRNVLGRYALCGIHGGAALCNTRSHSCGAKTGWHNWMVMVVGDVANLGGYWRSHRKNVDRHPRSPVAIQTQAGRLACVDRSLDYLVSNCGRSRRWLLVSR